MVEVRVNGKKLEVELRGSSVLRDHPGIDKFLVDLVTEDSYKLERYQIKESFNDSSITPFYLEAYYENEFLSNTMGKVVELWLGTRNIECELND